MVGIRALAAVLVLLGAATAHGDEGGLRVVPLTELHHQQRTAPPLPCEDETGRLFRDGPGAFVDGIRPQGYCGPPGWREERALREQQWRRYQGTSPR